MNAEMTNDCHTCYVGSGAPESGPHTCTRSALSTMSSFQPKSQISVTHNSSVFEHEEAKWPWMAVTKSLQTGLSQIFPSKLAIKSHEK